MQLGLIGLQMKIRPKFSLKLLMALFVILAVLLASWVLPTLEQMRICDTGMIGAYSQLESKSELPAWKQAVASCFGEHSVCKVIAVEIQPEYEFTVEDIRTFRHLKRLTIGGSDPVACGCDAIGQLGKLQRLSFERSGQLGNVSSFAKLVDLEKIELYQTRFDSGGSVLGRLPKLRLAHLRDCTLDQQQFDGIANSDSIQTLWIRIGPDLDLKKLWEMDQLLELGISRHDGWNNISPVLKLTNLSTLNLDNTFAKELPILKQLKQRGITGTYLDRLREIQDDRRLLFSD